MSVLALCLSWTRLEPGQTLFLISQLTPRTDTDIDRDDALKWLICLLTFFALPLVFCWWILEIALCLLVVLYLMFWLYICLSASYMCAFLCIHVSICLSEQLLYPGAFRVSLSCWRWMLWQRSSYCLLPIQLPIQWTIEMIKCGADRVENAWN